MQMDDSLIAVEEEADETNLSDLMERFSQDERVKAALAEGVDLREYSRRVEAELAAAERAAVLVSVDDRRQQFFFFFFFSFLSKGLH